MTHESYTEQISLWFDDQLDSAEAELLQAHLTECAECRQTYKQMHHVEALFQTAASVMIAPATGFTQRVEVRLEQAQARKPWQVWLAVMALLGGTLALGGFAAVAGGLAVMSVGLTLLDASVMYQGVAGLIASIDMVRGVVNLGALLFKAALITTQQPLFWGLAFMTVALIGLWVQLMRRLTRPQANSMEMLLL